MQQSLLRKAIVLGLLSAIGPFAIDMYLPSLPTIGQALDANPTEVQLSLLLFFCALGAGQLVYGPLSDRYGRKLPLYAGLCLFAVASVGCATARSIEMLIVFRFFQGLGACAGMVVPRAIVRDLHTGVEAAKLMSMLMLVFSVSPILAPLAGSFFIELAGWRSVFWAVTVAALLGLVMLSTSLQETRDVAARAGSSIGGAFAAYGRLLRDRHFLGLVFTGSFGVASFFAYLANSPFILIEHFGLTPMQFSVCFSVNAASFFACAQLTAFLAGRFGLKRVVRIAVTGYAAAMLVLLALFAAGVDRLDVLLALLFVGYGFLGLVIPTTAVLALDEHGAIAGAASALMGTLQFLTGVVVMLVVGSFLDGSAVPMIAGIALCAAIAFVLANLTLRPAFRAPLEASAD